MRNKKFPGFYRRIDLCVFVVTAVILFSSVGCIRHTEVLMERLPVEKTKIDFNNLIPESDSLNVIKDEYIYNGGGIGIGDFNGDNLQDIYFTGNVVANKLYLNKGDFEFEDITAIAGVAAEDIWSSGVSVIDINDDGRLDIYVCASFKKDPTSLKNKLFINLGTRDGIPVFEDQAEMYGIADDGHSTQGVFFDYDLDGDLDLYILTNVFIGSRSMTDEESITKSWEPTIDKLYRNNGDHSFTNVSAEAGITVAGFGLG
ncbi:MAG TPA: VCBS repeat-containing protein, partial [Cyclobacteriaceae bacterium]|nr:VCBS repeat-containing protein [Cyclobacteriaceae bacterium]